MRDSRRIGIVGVRGLVVAALSATILASACTAKTEDRRPALARAPGTGEQPRSLKVAATDPGPVEQLELVFPEIAGWTRGPISGDRATETVPGMATPVAYAGVQTTYSGPQIHVDVYLIDSVELVRVFDRQLESDRSYRRASFQRYPAWTNRYGSKLQVVVKGRFALTLETGTAHDDLSILSALAQQFDLAHLARLD